jgi:hypothetical protein
MRVEIKTGGKEMEIAYCTVCNEWTEHESHQGHAGYLCLGCFIRHEPEVVINDPHLIVKDGIFFSIG